MRSQLDAVGTPTGTPGTPAVGTPVVYTRWYTWTSAQDFSQRSSRRELLVIRRRTRNQCVEQSIYCVALVTR